MSDEMNDSIEPEVATSEDVVDTEGVDNDEKDIYDMTDEEFEAHYDDNASESSEDEPDGDTDKKTPDEDLESLYSAQMADADAKLDKPLVIKVKGRIYKVDSVNELKNLAELGTNGVQKFQAIAEHRKTLDFMSDNGITMEHLQSLITDSGNEPVMRDESVSAAEDVATEIMNSPNAQSFIEVANMLPNDVKQEMASNPQMMRGFNDDVASGLAQKIMPMVDRYMNVGGMSFMQAYVRAGNEAMSSGSIKQQPQQQNNVADEKMKTLNSQPVSKSNVSNALSTEDIDKMSDAEFERYYQEM